MNIRMLTPACNESKRLIDWVEQGQHALRCFHSAVCAQCYRRSASHGCLSRAFLCDAGVQDALQKGYLKVLPLPTVPVYKVLGTKSLQQHRALQLQESVLWPFLAPSARA